MKKFVRKIPASKSKKELDELFDKISKIGNISVLEAKEIWEKRLNTTDLYDNDTYTVTVDKSNTHVIHLSIRRNDRNEVHDWRDLQEIKNLLVGKEYIGVEIYPRENDVVDTANQYHLWVFKDKNFRFPFGFDKGLKSDESIEGQTKQRKF